MIVCNTLKNKPKTHTKKITQRNTVSVYSRIIITKHLISSQQLTVIDKLREYTVHIFHHISTLLS